MFFFVFFVHLEKWWCCSTTLLLSHPYDPKHHEKCVFFSVLNQPSHTFFLCYVLVVFEGMTWRALLKKRSFMEGAGTHHKFLNSLAFPHLWWHTWETWHFYHNYYVNYINNLTKQLKLKRLVGATWSYGLTQHSRVCMYHTDDWWRRCSAQITMSFAIQVDIRACWQIQEKEKLEKLLLFWPYLHLGLTWRHSQINLRVFYRWVSWLGVNAIWLSHCAHKPSNASY